MAAITTAGSGNWSSTTPNAPWPSGTVPTSADTVTIANTHTVTLDTTGCVCLSLTVASGGTLTCSTSASSDLTIHNNATFNTGSICTLDLSSTNTYTCNIIGNGASSSTAYIITFNDGANILCKGFARKRVTRLNGAVTASASPVTFSVDDATGWAIGDVLCLATTDSGYTAAKSEFLPITAISGKSITVASVGYNHADNGYVGNMSSNLTFRPASNASQNVSTSINSNATSSASASNTRLFQDVAFVDMGQITSNPYSLRINVTHANNSAWYGAAAGLKNCAFYNYWNIGFQLASTTDGAVFDIGIDTNVMATTRAGSQLAGVTYSGGFFSRQSVKNTYILRGGVASSCIGGVLFGRRVWENLVVCGTQYMSAAQSFTIDGGSLFGNGTIFYTQKDTILNNVNIGTEFSAHNNNVFDHRNTGTIAAINCQMQTSGNIVTSHSSTMIDGAQIYLNNKNGYATSQEIYTNQSYTTPAIQRDNTTTKSALSSVLMTCNKSDAISYAFDILAKATTALRILVWVQVDATYDNSTYTLPSVSISGLDAIATTVSTTSACIGAWELVSLDLTSDDAPTSDGLLTVTFTAQSATAGSKAYFSGIALPPFITRARHYGYLFQETIPTVTVDPYVVAAEATAAAYTGVTIDGTGKDITFAAGTADTAQKFYDYSRAWCALNVDKEVPFERAGSIYALDADWTVVDPYYSGTLTWSGGTIQYSTYGTKSDNLDGCIIEFADTGGGTYTFDGTLSGTLDLRNLDADPITVEVPTGTTTTDANNTGGTITVQEPQVYQSVVLSSGEAGSRVQLYDVTSSTELYNDVPGSWPFTWTDPDPYSADREIRLRVAYTDGADARQFIDQTIGTVTEADPELTYLVAQIDDAVYNANAIDGSALTGYAIVGANLTIDVSDGTATWAEMYAYQVYWLSTEDGIRDQDLFIFGIDTANYLFYGGFKIKNTSAPSVPLLVTGGNGEPSSGPATDLLDTTGGTIFCNSAIVVPYSSGAEVTEQIVRDGLTSQGYTTTRAGKIDTVPDDVWAEVLEGTLTAAQIQRIKLAALAGKRQGIGTATEAYLAQDGVTPRVTFTPADAAGNGTTVVDGA